MRIYHNSYETEYREPFGAVTTGSKINLSLRIEGEEGEDLTDVGSVYIRLWRDETGESFTEMHITRSEGNVRTYTGEIEAPDETGLLWYYFVTNVSGNTLYYGNNGEQNGGVGQTYDYEPPSYQITVYEHAPVPLWYKEAIVYQIFPDRFARDDNWEARCKEVIEERKGAGLQGQGKFIEDDWYRPAYYVKDEDGNVTDWPFYGGSLRGIESKLDYLTSLGVGAIYLNPVFEAASNHRYDTGDYMKIDPMLGTYDDFAHLADEARKRGIRIILDGVFSHTGADSIYFDKYGNYGGDGAFDNPESPYRSWYEFRDDDRVGYRSWWGVRDLPEVNETEDSFRELICGSEGVLAKWLRAGASGWRLDVADELPDSFIREIRHRIKEEDRDNLLLGEVWEDASNKISYGEKRKYLMGDELDSTMNYPLRDLLMDFAEYRLNSEQVAARVMSLAENYPEENFYGALNLIGSHDRQRILTGMGAEQDYGRAVAKVKMLSLLQYTLPGVPCIYYGDEAGLTGGTDPDNRNGYPWERENEELKYHYRILGLTYREHEALRSGKFRVICSDNDDIFSFAREGSDEVILIAVNRSESDRNLSAETINRQLGSEKFEFMLELMTSKLLATENGRLKDDIYIEPYGYKVICMKNSLPQSFKMKRAAGVICHISSVPGGKLGKPSREFADYIKSAGMSLWQILPLNPPGLGDSPYSSGAAFAGDAGLVNPDELPDMGGYDDFCGENSYWLSDYAKYMSIKETGKEDDSQVISRVKEEQYYFHAQWQELKEYANGIGLEIIGDLPIFVSNDSADIGANRELFQIDEAGDLKRHAGVPPDYFSPEGQDWGNPLYDWDAMREDGYRWWKARLRQAFNRYDYVRLDHFRSFSQYYAIPYGMTPASGTWQHGPGMEFFESMAEEFGGSDKLRIVAEDLGILDSGVYNLLKMTGLPGMNVWQFNREEMESMAEDEASRRVFYTGTHDNQTLMGWCRDRDMNYGDALGIIRKLYESRAPWVIIQVQDMFMMNDEARMNVPGVPEGNWKWRLPGDHVYEIGHADKIAAAFELLARETGRCM